MLMVRPREYSWSLSGDQDPSHQVISEEAWYRGLDAIQQRHEEQYKSGSNTAQRILAEGDLIGKDDTDTKKGRIKAARRPVFGVRRVLSD